MAYKTLGLALSGGGLRGAAHLGVIKALMNNGIKPDFISGTSSGSVAAALYATGQNFSALSIDERFTAKGIEKFLDWECGALGMMWAAINFPFFRRFKLPMGVIKGSKIEEGLKLLTSGKGFDDTELPLAVIAADLKTGKGVIFTSQGMSGDYPKDTDVIIDAKISEACRASISIPGIFKPKSFKNRLLIDGGVRDNVPVEILKIWGADVIVAVDLKLSNQNDEEINSIFHVLLQTVDIMGQALSDCKTQQFADIVIDPQIYSMSLLDFRKIPECIKKGEEAAIEAVPIIKRLLNRR